MNLQTVYRNAWPATPVHGYNSFIIISSIYVCNNNIMYAYICMKARIDKEMYGFPNNEPKTNNLVIVAICVN